MYHSYSPFEELEYLADYLPEEGEAVIVARRDGELVCETYPRETARDSLSDPEFYGRLVQANERLQARAWLPFACGVLAWFWLAAGLHRLTGQGIEGWYLDAGLGLSVLFGCLVWIRRRQHSLFQHEIRPMLAAHLRRRGLDRYSVIGDVRPRRELRTLLDELTRWDD